MATRKTVRWEHLAWGAVLEDPPSSRAARVTLVKTLHPTEPLRVRLFMTHTEVRAWCRDWNQTVKDLPQSCRARPVRVRERVEVV
jgi:hypothetical protein